MNISAYDLDSLRRIVRKLYSENLRLKHQLDEANIAYDSDDPFSEGSAVNGEYDPDQGARISSCFITTDMVRQFCKIGTQITGAERHIVISLWKAAQSSIALLFWCLPGSRMKRNGRILHRRHRTLHQEYR